MTVASFSAPLVHITPLLHASCFVLVCAGFAPAFCTSDLWHAHLRSCVDPWTIHHSAWTHHFIHFCCACSFSFIRIGHPDRQLLAPVHPFLLVAVGQSPHSCVPACLCKSGMLPPLSTTIHTCIFFPLRCGNLSPCPFVVSMVCVQELLMALTAAAKRSTKQHHHASPHHAGHGSSVTHTQGGGQHPFFMLRLLFEVVRIWT